MRLLYARGLITSLLGCCAIDAPSGNLGVHTQPAQMGLAVCYRPDKGDFAGDNRLIECRDQGGDAVANGFSLHPLAVLASHVPARLVHGLDALSRSHERPDGRLAISLGSLQEIHAERFVGLAGHVLRDLGPHILHGDGGQIAKGAVVADGLEGRFLRNHGPGVAASPALGDVGGKAGHPGGTAGQGIDVLGRCDALAGVDGHGVAGTNEKPAG